VERGHIKSSSGDNREYLSALPGFVSSQRLKGIERRQPSPGSPPVTRASKQISSKQILAGPFSGGGRESVNQKKRVLSYFDEILKGSPLNSSKLF